MSKRLPESFYQRSDVVEIARDLLGKVLLTKIGKKISGGIIVETEAYNGANDKASHAYPNKITKRTEIMFGEGGFAYVYLCYGLHYLFNVVTNVKGVADAVLIRAIEPVIGLNIIKKRRGTSLSRLTSGPGKLSQGLGITTRLNAKSLAGNLIWIEEGNDKDFEIDVSKRIGVDYAGKDAFLPWRFSIKNNSWVSKN